MTFSTIPKLSVEKIKNSSRSPSNNIEGDTEKLNLKLKNIPQQWGVKTSPRGPYIETSFNFKHYSEALKALHLLCDLQEMTDHHTNFVLENFNSLKVELCTHNPVWGVSEMDLAFAEVLSIQLKEIL